jgi:hypothetical protein
MSPPPKGRCQQRRGFTDSSCRDSKLRHMCYSWGHRLTMFRRVGPYRAGSAIQVMLEGKGSSIPC